MKSIIIIQARMGSSRLPGKILKPLGDSVVLDYVVSRCKLVESVDEVIVATSSLSQDDTVEQWCLQNNVPCFRGSEDDVLERYYKCAKLYEPDYVIRVTSDCPFVDYELANDVIAEMKTNPADIVLLNGKLPRGLAVEMISFSALEYIFNNGYEPRHREHVTYYAYEFSEKFKATTLTVPEVKQHPELRITLDTYEDYQLCQAIAQYSRGDKLVPSQTVVNFLLEHPEIAKLNAHIEQKPVI
ncbi:glycosyltransferase family protein [Schinkia azotoformans]|uniref:glycosyltransferase family protein n=1 Tax=Schinkia azotoformans TaxID=1454 RepID=UPI002E1C9855|nr:glycosyltransferase family protein [Schinkia azotoformans]